MKIQIILIALISYLSIADAQNPIPIHPVKNVTVFEGEWYVVLAYFSNLNNNYALEYSCYTWNVSLGNPFGNVSIYMDLLGNTQTLGYPLFPTPDNTNNNTVWNALVYWIALDPISQSWGTIGQGSSSAFILSRTPTLSNLIIQSQVKLLQVEGYGLNASNTFASKNDECPN